MADTNDAKRELRRTMRVVRRNAASAERSAAICDRLMQLVTSDTRLVLVFDAVPGEPDLSTFVRQCAERGISTVAPDPTPVATWPVDPSQVDVAVVPGIAFTRDGRRLGQGGGWYDRFLAVVRDDCRSVGVCFDEQLVDDLPTEPHDARLGWVVTPTGSIRFAEFPSSYEHVSGTRAADNALATDRGGRNRQYRRY